MTQLQESKNSSYKLLKDLFVSNESITGELPSFSNFVSKFNQNCIEIDNLVAKQGVDKSGLKDNKELRREALIVQTLDVSKRMLAYATVEEIATLKTEAKVTDSELRKLADTKLKARAQGIHALALTNTAGLAPYGITPEVTARLLANINAYDTAIPQPKLGINDAKQNTAKLDALFKDNDGQLKKTDAVIELVKTSHPDFYNSYKNLRKVVTTGKGKLAMQVMVKDAVTGEGIQKVMVVIEEANGDGKKQMSGAELVKNVKHTSKKGGFKLKSLPEGTYTITASKPGFATEVITVNVVAGELSNVAFKFVKNPV